MNKRISPDSFLDKSLTYEQLFIHETSDLCNLNFIPAPWVVIEGTTGDLSWRGK